LVERCERSVIRLIKQIREEHLEIPTRLLMLRASPLNSFLVGNDVLDLYPRIGATRLIHNVWHRLVRRGDAFKQGTQKALSLLIDQVLTQPA
jgi:hypothetical protein